MSKKKLKAPTNGHGKDHELPPLEPLGVEKPLDGSGNGRRLEVSADMLTIAKENMRHNHVPDPALIASMQHHGQLNDLICHDRNDGLYAVVDGGRRYVSIVQGIKTGALPKDFLIRIRIMDEATKEISLAGNLHLAAHPLDTCEAILELAKTAEDEQAIAAHFGQSITWVQQRARLAGLSDKAKQAYRDGRLDLGIAQLMTRLPEKMQDALCKGKDRIYDQDVKQALAGAGVDCGVALFDWATLYPPEKIQKSLFDDMVILLDRQLFKDHQDKAVSAKIKTLVDQGYNVEKLKREDYATEQKYVGFEGKVKPEIIASLHYLVKPDYSGLQWKFIGPLINRKTAEKVKKNGKGKADTTTAEPVVLKADDLTVTQHQLLSAHLVMHRRRAMIDGKGISQGETMWRAIEVLLKAASEHNGPVMTWARYQKDHPGEFLDVDAVALGKTLDDISQAAFLKLKPEARLKVFNAAVAATLEPPYGSSVKENAKKYGTWRIQPGEAFFKKYRTDQLLDYLKRSGVTKNAGGMPIDNKKATAVSVAIATAAGKGAWQFGLDK